MGSLLATVCGPHVRTLYLPGSPPPPWWFSLPHIWWFFVSLVQMIHWNVSMEILTPDFIYYNFIVWPILFCLSNWVIFTVNLMAIPHSTLMSKYYKVPKMYGYKVCHITHILTRWCYSVLSESTAATCT